MPASPRRRWCLLIHSLPARPLYLRARIRKLLAESGAAPIRKAVYALPASAPALERLRVIAVEIESGGGSAFVCEATFPDEEVERSVERACRIEVHARYREWITDAAAPRSLEHLRRRLDLLRSAHPYAAPGASEAAALLARLERGPAPSRRAGSSSLANRVWVTRRGLHVDRLACAWVVRRFVDHAARFRFVTSPDSPLAAREIGFDMPGAEISHADGGCSVESLVRRVGVQDPAVRRIAEIVHDIDLRDGRFGHAETPGFEQLLLGVIATAPRDEERLERGLGLFDMLHAALGTGAVLAAGTAKPLPTVRMPAPPARRRRRT